MSKVILDKIFVCFLLAVTLRAGSYPKDPCTWKQHGPGCFFYEKWTENAEKIFSSRQFQNIQKICLGNRYTLRKNWNEKLSKKTFKMDIILFVCQMRPFKHPSSARWSQNRKLKFKTAGVSEVLLNLASPVLDKSSAPTVELPWSSVIWGEMVHAINVKVKLTYQDV